MSSGGKNLCLVSPFELRVIFRARDAVLLEGQQGSGIGIIVSPNKLAHFGISCTSGVATSLPKEALIHGLSLK